MEGNTEADHLGPGNKTSLWLEMYSQDTAACTYSLHHRPECASFACSLIAIHR